MITRVLRPAITVSTVMAVLVAALAVYAYLNTGTTHADSTYAPVTTAKMCNDMPASFPDPQIAGASGACAEASGLANSAAANYTTTLTYASGDLNFSNVVTMAPGTFSPSGTENITAGDIGAAFPVGTKVGGLHSDTTLGVLNGTCNSSIGVDFVFFNVALPNGGTANPRSSTGPGLVHGASTNIAFPLVEGANDRFSHWKVGLQADGTGAGGDQLVTDANFPTIADNTNLSIQNYPSYLLDIFDPTFVPGVGAGSGPPIVPKAVYGGLSHVVGTWIPLYFAQFAESGVHSLAGMPAPLGLMTPAMGQPSVSVLNDPTAFQASVSSITSFCTPLGVTTMLLGTSPDGHVRATNPATSGTGFFVQYNASLRDLDQDGNENVLDTCPSIPDPAHDPRNPARPGDTDADGIGNVCDLEVGGASSFDEDGDLFQNAQDNCPQVSNPDQKQSSIAFAQADNGPRTDGIGDACSGSLTVGTAGAGTDGCSGFTIKQNGVCISIPNLTDNTIAHGRYMVATNVVAKCFGGTDVDKDGYCATEDLAGSSSTDGAVGNSCLSTAPPSCAVRHSAWGPGLASSAMDSDSDGFTDAMETYLGTDPTKSCAAQTTAGLETISNWPMDFNNDQQSGVLDVTSYSSLFNKPVNTTVAHAFPAYPPKRWDLNGDGLIGILDLTFFSSTFNKKCGHLAQFPTMPGPFVQQ